MTAPQVSQPSPLRLLLLRILLLLGLVGLGRGWRDHLGDERGELEHVVRDDGRVFVLLFDGLLHESPDNFTVEALHSTLMNSTRAQETRLTQVGEPLESLRKKAVNPDEVMRVTILRATYTGSPIKWLSVTPLGNIINPSITVWRGKLVLSFKYAIEDYMVFKVINDTTSAEDFSSIVFHPPGWTANCSTNTNGKAWEFVGEDSRMVPLPDGSLHFAFTSHHEWNYRMYISTARIVNETDRLVQFERKLWFSAMEDGYFPKHWGRHQKNWVPFLLGEKIYYVQTFNPFHVMELKRKGSPPSRGQPGCGYPSANLAPETNESHAFCVSTSVTPGINTAQFGWSYGDLRGGTPGVLLPDGKHILALFHTRHKLPENMLETYFFGAVTWCANATNLRLHSMSRTPIVNHTLYDGAWTPNRSGHSRVDYVVFPLGLVVNATSNSVTISFGHQDSFGFLAQIELTSLLRSMIVVGDQC